MSMKLSEMRGVIDGVEIGGGCVHLLAKTPVKSAENPGGYDVEIVKVDFSGRVTENKDFLEDIINRRRTVPVRIIVETLED